MAKPVNSRYVVASTVVLFALSGCGTSDGGGDGATAPPSRDKGPLCAGEATAGGLHVLRGGGFRLPGGGGVQYAAAHADGKTRSAIVRDGARYEAGQKQQTVEPGQRITVSGDGYTVTQICSYRVVLEPQDEKVRAAVAAAPDSLESQGGPADNGLCFSTNRSVLAAASKGFPPKGETQSLLDNSGVWTSPTGLSVTAHVGSEARTGGISASCAGIKVAGYEDVRVGDTVEFANVLFKVSELSDDVVRMKRTSG
ncbi:hypothetical protein [Streptomyces purpurascens]|uniref:hypothetical protein n=1 Tax=Streptomyces purpurascens TaxID=1924 RepID=UPI0016755141|nr:hypothetical protein [Streptomyces purpurascens]MCE7050000.1 hypothetical protein [Streptomyces purpurascens]GHA49272.1 hypothetical protein GCM10010303_70740 [Streptomyces purpurascens]